MAFSTGQNRVYRFGVYQADSAAGELRKKGAPVKLQEQPFRVLLLLLERPGGLVTREEIRKTLWSGDTFVDFDHSLNTLVNKLRDALGDDAANPRFIETLARRGYRFIAPVEVSGDAQPTSSEAGDSVESSLLTALHELPDTSRNLVRGLFALVQVMYLSFYLVSLAKLGAISHVAEQAVSRPNWIMALVLLTATTGIPTRLFLLAGVAFDTQHLGGRFQKLFPFIFPLDELWALAPFLAVHQLGVGLAFAATAALLYVPFAQRTLVLMGYRRTLP